MPSGCIASFDCSDDGGAIFGGSSVAVGNGVDGVAIVYDLNSTQSYNISVVV